LPETLNHTKKRLLGVTPTVGGTARGETKNEVTEHLEDGVKLLSEGRVDRPKGEDQGKGKGRQEILWGVLAQGLVLLIPQRESECEIKKQRGGTEKRDQVSEVGLELSQREQINHEA